MAGFFPHLGNYSTTAFTSLPLVPATGILDQIVQDINTAGGTVNGWTVYDNMLSGSSFPKSFWAFNNGRWTNSNNGSNSSWTFTNGSPYFVGNAQNGYNVACSLSYNNTSQLSASEISVDGVNWYKAWIYSWPNQYVTGVLDRNWAQTTVNTRDLAVRSTKWVVLKNTNTLKDLYILIAHIANSPFYYVQPYGSWNSTTHVGTEGGPQEMLRPVLFHNQNLVTPGVGQGGSINAYAQYILCLYPNAFFLWTCGYNAWPMAQSVYLCNLDTTGIVSSDPDAIWFGASDTSYSGLQVARGTAFNNAYASRGASTCYKTRSGWCWANNDTYNSLNIPMENMYEFVPRGRTYLQTQSSVNVTNLSKVEMCDVDIYHCGYNTTDTTTFGMTLATEGRRGTLRYMKVPSTNPVGLHLTTTGPASDGNQYIIIRHSRPLAAQGGPVDGGGSMFNTNDWATSGLMPSSYAYCIELTGQVGELMGSSTSVTALFRYIMMPII